MRLAHKVVERIFKMKNEISFAALWKVFAKSWKIILILVITAMLVMGLVTNYVMDKKYSSSVTFYVINVAHDTEYVTTSLMQVIEHLANDYIQIIGSDIMLEPLCDILVNEYSIEYTPDQIRSMIKTSVKSDSSTFTVKITNTDKNHAYVITQLIANEAPAVVKAFTSTNPTTDNDEAEENENVFATIGMYPEYCNDENLDLSFIYTLAKSSKVVAIGEIGLDYHRDNKNKENQKKHFIEQIIP